MDSDAAVKMLNAWLIRASRLICHPLSLTYDMALQLLHTCWMVGLSMHMHALLAYPLNTGAGNELKLWSMLHAVPVILSQPVQLRGIIV